MLLGIDVSTTASKALLLDESGQVRGIASSAHTLSTPRPLWSEQDPEQWWSATISAIREVLANAGVDGSMIRSIGLTGQMHGLVLLDAAGEVIRPAILWNDQRSSEQCDWIRDRLGLDELVRITGNDAFPGFTAPKLLWVRDHEPEAYARIAQVLLPKDYIRYRLTGTYATDRAGAGGTLLLDLTSRTWSTPVLEALDIPADWLPPTFEGTHETGRIASQAAGKTGLKEGTTVVAGGGDQAAQAVGVGAVTPSTHALTIGTSGVVFAPSDQPVTDPKGSMHAFPHAIPGLWHVMGVMLSAAGSLQWYRDTMAPEIPFSDLVAEAADVAPGCDGLTFLPYLTGERTPHADPEARGAFIGLTRAHNRGHMTRSVLEGVGFGLLDNQRLLAQCGVQIANSLRASGGAMQSPLWRQMLADILSTPLEPVETTEGGALGAAMLAGAGAGVWSSIHEAVAQIVKTGDPVLPGPDHAAAYEEAYERFKALYPALRAVSNVTQK